MTQTEKWAKFYKQLNQQIYKYINNSTTNSKINTLLINLVASCKLYQLMLQAFLIIDHEIKQVNKYIKKVNKKELINNYQTKKQLIIFNSHQTKQLQKFTNLQKIHILHFQARNSHPPHSKLLFSSAFLVAFQRCRHTNKQIKYQSNNTKLLTIINEQISNSPLIFLILIFKKISQSINQSTNQKNQSSQQS
ncbi:hypothetical protein ABPG72_007157 [Tetrahymena utriculariae]